MEIRIYPDPVLRVAADPVTDFDDDLRAFARAMVETMHANRGLGLAAPQVGDRRRLVIISPDGEPGHETVLVNPRLTQRDGWETGDEGCLSFPGIYVKIRRYARVSAEYEDLEGKTRVREAEGLPARAVQHEIDHLDGRLLVDRMSAVQRMSHRRRLRELERRYAQSRPHAPASVGGGGE